eukprot:TRINITY_DN54591_c0_g1_i1.p1 TRINITY_DN54591_c0_g1~~TRINITY_DN54591_c0_g1_i1.p1  ORF type:complete len:324 (-),score=77.92 TRINITY_DN54591_c0_g1_i1:159-1130(-)
MAPPTTGPFLATAALAAALLGGGGWYYSSPDNQEMVRSEFLELKERFLELEDNLVHGVQSGKDRLMDKVRRGKERFKARKDRVAAKMKELLHRFDRNADGQLDPKEIDLDGDGAFDSDDLAAIVDDVVGDSVSEQERPWFLTTEYLVLFGLVDAVVIGLGLLSCIGRKDPTANVNPKGTLKLEIVSAEGLLNVDSGKNGNVSDPYAVAQVDSAGKIQTSTVKNNLNPQWKKAGTIKVDCSKEKQKVLSVEIFDGKDGLFDMSASKSLGSADVDISASFRARPGEQVMRTLHLHGGSEGLAQGTVTVAGTFVPDPLPKAKAKKA